MTNNQNRLLIASQQSQNQQQRQNQSSTTTANDKSPNSSVIAHDDDDPSSMVSVDDDFDAYWREEARNPHRNRIRIGRQYQATVPALLKKGEKDTRKLNELETMSFCPKKSSKVSDSELDHYFTIAKSLNIFANLVETRSLLGRDVTIADLNHIRHKEGLSLASVIQPTRQTANYGQVSTSNPATSTTLAPNQISSTPTSPTTPTKSSTEPTSSSTKSQAQLTDSEKIQQQSSEQQLVSEHEKVTLNQPLLRALSHFISLHHPCHHDPECKKLTKEAPLEDNSLAPVLRHGSFSGKETKNRISRSAAKQQLQQQLAEARGDDTNPSDNQTGDSSSQAQAYDDWTREEVELFSKAIEVCGKNFGSIKKDFLPSKSVKSIVEYYYIGYRDSSDGGKKKTSQSGDANDGCSSPDKCLANNDGGGNGGGGAGNNGSKNRAEANNSIATSSTSATTTTTPATTTPHASAAATTSNTRTGTLSGRNNLKSENNDVDKKLAGATSSTFGMITSNDNNNQNKRVKDMNSSSRSNSNQQSSIIVKQENINSNPSTTNSTILSNNNNIDKRMSVYNFDDDNNKDEPAVQMMECSRPGPEVRPLKAKPVLPSASSDLEADSDAGSLKFFMDGKMVLKLNACQDQQQGIDKCHWVQSNDKTNPSSNRQKRYLKRGNPAEKAPSNGSSQNGSNIESSPSSQTTQEDLSRSNKNDYYKFIKNMNIDEDSKESMNSSSTVSQNQDQLQQNTSLNNNNINNINNLNSINSNNNSNINNNNNYNNIINNNSNINNSNNNNNNNNNINRSQKRQKVKNPPQTTQISTSTSSSPNTANDLYNGLAGNSQGGLMNPNYAFQRDPNMMAQANNPMISQAMPWLQANHIAMAAAILGGLPGFPGGPVMQHNMPNLNPAIQQGSGGPLNMNHQNIGINPPTMNNNSINNNNIPAMPVTSKPMDLSLEHNVSPKSPQKTSGNNRSRSRQVPRNV